MAWGGMVQKLRDKTGIFSPQTQFNRSPLGSSINAGMVNNAPAFGQFDNNASALMRKQYLNDVGAGYSREGLNLGYESQMGDLNTQLANTGIEQGAAARQPGLIDQILASQNRDFDISRAGLGTEFGQKRYDLNSDATARGANLSGGTNQGRRTLFEQLSQGMGHLTEAQTQNTLNATEQKAQAQDRIATLNNTAANLNMKPAQLQKELTLGLKKSGLDQVISADDLLTALKNNDLQARQLLNDIILKSKDYATARGVQ